ncbi:sensor histidine kinase [Cohnella fermenti]|uniref:sensor histidine kinase n=1 Tax=Cohnella fermenti TaxID=2565925 RepID=UPI001454C43C|nr:histidine kinase [Cohnella fermenti]
MRKPSGFHRRLFLLYSALLLAVVVSSFLVFYLHASRQQEKIYANSFERELSAYVGRVDNAIANADRQLVQIKSHPGIASLFLRLSLDENASASIKNNPEWVATTRDAIDGIHGLDPQVFQRVTVIGRSGAYIGTGFNNPDVPPETMRKRIDALQSFWFDDSFRLVRYPAEDLLEPQRPPVVSLIRKITYSGLAHSIVEIQLSGEFFAKMAAVALPASNTVDRSLYVYSTDNRWHAIQGDSSSLDSLPQQPSDLPDLYFAKKRHTLQFIQRSSNTGWLYAMTLPTSPLNASLRDLSVTVLALGMLVCAIGMSLIYLLTRRTLLPLHRLRKAMAQIDPVSLESNVTDSLLRLRPDQFQFDEIRDLHASFQDMLQRLQQSQRETTNAKEAELRARLLALQKQVDPHFLYNTLSIIGMLGYEQGDEHILDLCRSLINMFKYVSYGDSYTANLADELDHLRDYMRIMSIRYDGKLTFDVDVPDDMLGLQVPKLLLQPLAENAIKHGFTERQECWKITVRGEWMATGWRIEVEDNGRGFGADIQERLAGYWEALDTNLSAEANRGLMNTMTRLKYLFGPGMRFDCTAGPAGGALLRMSMTVESKGEEPHVAYRIGG